MFIHFPDSLLHLMVDVCIRETISAPIPANTNKPLNILSRSFVGTKHHRSEHHFLSCDITTTKVRVTFTEKQKKLKKTVSDLSAFMFFLC